MNSKCPVRNEYKELLRGPLFAYKEQFSRIHMSFSPRTGLFYCSLYS